MIHRTATDVVMSAVDEAAKDDGLSPSTYRLDLIWVVGLSGSSSSTT